MVAVHAQGHHVGTDGHELTGEHARRLRAVTEAAGRLREGP